MRHGIAIAVVAVLLAIPATAQQRGTAAQPFSSSGWGGFSGMPFDGRHHHSNVCSAPSGGRSTCPQPPPFFGSGFIQDPRFPFGGPQDFVRANRFFRHHRFFGGGFYYPLYPYYQPEEQPEPAEQNPDLHHTGSIYYIPSPPQARPATAYEIPEQQAPARPQVSVRAEQQPEHPQPPTVLVFKDGHTLEVHNYVMTTTHVWNLDVFPAQPILLSLLNLDATVRQNQERGLEFTIPKQLVPHTAGLQQTGMFGFPPGN